MKMMKLLYHQDQFLGLPGSSSLKSTSKAGSWVALLAAEMLVMYLLRGLPSALRDSLTARLFSGSAMSAISEYSMIMSSRLADSSREEIEELRLEDGFLSTTDDSASSSGVLVERMSLVLITDSFETMVLPT